MRTVDPNLWQTVSRAPQVEGIFLHLKVPFWNRTEHIARAIAAFDVSAATISIRPSQRAHFRTSAKNTRQIREAQDSLLGSFGGDAPRGKTGGSFCAGANLADGTIRRLLNACA